MSEIVIVSVIIHAYNSLEKLTRALQSIEKIDFPVECYEVIVVDDGSSDGTGEDVKELVGKNKITLHYVYQENRGPAAARNTGIKLAMGRYLLIIDADCLVDRNILKRYLSHFPDETLGGVGGNVRPDHMNLITEYLDYIGVWRPGNKKGEVIYLVTANAFFLKEAVVKAGYFDEDFKMPGGEEPELCYRMIKRGYQFKYDENAEVIHSHRTTFKGIMRMFFTHGKGRAIFDKKWPNARETQVSLLRIIIGEDAIIRFICDFMRKVGPVKAFIFFVFEYTRLLAFYCGYRSERRRCDNIHTCEK